MTTDSPLSRRAFLGSATAAFAAAPFLLGAPQAAAGSLTVNDRSLPASLSVIPRPALLTPTGGPPFQLTPHTAIVVRHPDPAARQAAEQFAELLRRSTGFPLPVQDESGSPQAILFAVSDEPTGAEGYRLDVTPGLVAIRATAVAGLHYGAQSLRQLLPPETESTTVQARPWPIPAVHIADEPRFVWRGAMLDVARHFFGVTEVKRFIDVIAAYKINRLHLHLSDSQGWRLEIPSWPRLATYGGSTEVDGTPGGYFTQADYQEIVAYAAQRFITVVPELDMPAHVNAALASYPELNEDGVAPPLYTGYKGIQVSLAIDKDITYRFAEDVLTTVAGLTPGPYLHIGGDEALATTAADYRLFINRIQQIVQTLGKQVVGWEEINTADLAPGTHVQYWADVKKARAAVAKGGKLIMSPCKQAYYDQQYNADTPIGLNWAGYTDVQDAYSWDPGSCIADVSETDVLGPEAPLWTENIRTDADVEFMTLPRMPGLAELGWSPVAGRSWDEYRYRLAAQEPRWTAMGVGYYRSTEVPWQ
ncbi:hexosaminidase [Hamadaea flava]|uniref:beta-N-acetylhexosaminidase n=1 Tax=Hamadaea flava TaxID=1742688 RepID=A0ABV8LTA8_9ACTN|nr:beta-N-acetylhexosaminidase [Hamadaea flava]MCP2328716.1 hexosaminidase [Hamadaea flava]